MIAVWLVGPPSVVARPMIRAGSRPAVSAGARSGAHRIDGTSGVGTPGSGNPLSSAMTRSRMSRRSVTRSAIRPPILVNISANFSTDSAVARTAAVPVLIRFSASPSQARSCASSAVAASTSDAEPVECAARSRSRSATVVAAVWNRAVSASRSASATSGAAITPSSPGCRPGRMTGPYATPGTTGTPVRTGPDVLRCEAGAGVVVM